MRQMRFSIREAGGRELAMADTREDADAAVATLREEVHAEGRRKYANAELVIIDNLDGFRQARVVATEGEGFTVYVTDETDASGPGGAGGYLAVDNPFTKESEQAHFLLGEDGFAYEEDAVTPMGTWVGMWVNEHA